ncbi:DUF6226 family protein [Marisediminicola antarctica]|uniref:DUF6226 family protein n=1 Tax=Marisediminicola antarctica TaxID=674079 RepID=UPI003AB1231F
MGARLEPLARGRRFKSCQPDRKPFPDCGCDACDDDAQSVAEGMGWAYRPAGRLF